jgi:hypothetical protein
VANRSSGFSGFFFAAKTHAPPGGPVRRRRDTQTQQIRASLLGVAVMLGVMLRGLGRGMRGVQAMRMGDVGVVTALFGIAVFIVLGRLAVMPGGFLVILGSLLVMVGVLVLHDVISQVSMRIRKRLAGTRLRAARDGGATGT